MIHLAFTVPGPPIPKGSMTARILGKRIRIGGALAVILPRAILVDQQNMARKSRKSGALDKWSKRVGDAATRALRYRNQDQLWLSASPHDFELSAEFIIPRPPSHFLKSLRIAKGKPVRPGKPDLSKLIRAIEDALTGIVWVDDSQIVSYGSVSKRYASAPGKIGGVRIAIREISASDQTLADGMGAQ